MHSFRFPATAIAAALVLCIPFSVAAHPQQLDIDLDLSGNYFAYMSVLPNDNIVVVDSSYSTPSAAQVGSVILLRPDGSLVSTLTGTIAGDRIGADGIVILANGNFVVQSSNWHCADSGLANCGAATWVDARLGRNGAVSAANSVVGITGDAAGNGGDRVGRQVFALRNGDYVVRGSGTAISPGLTGTLTRGNGATGTSGPVTAANSLTGASQGDLIGDTVVSLPNGDIVVASPAWNNNRGAVTQIRSGQPLQGVVNATNSVVGALSGDSVGASVTLLGNGNYVICSPNWNASAAITSAGAATWVGANAPLTGTLTAAASLVGTQTDDQVCGGGVVALDGNGNYVVTSRRYKSGASMIGAATWGNGSIGVRGAVSAANSLVGVGGNSNAPMPVSVTALRGNGNYVVAFARSIYASGVAGDTGGAAPVVWANGASGIAGAVSSASASYVSATESLFDSIVYPLENGHFVVARPSWNASAGAVNWGNGALGGPVGLLSPSVALTGAHAADNIGAGGVFPLRGGNYVVVSPFWVGNAGAVTWVGGAGPTSGQVSAANSLVGPRAGSKIGIGGVAALANGNYFFGSPYWDTPDNRGGWTWGDGLLPMSGVLGIANTVAGSSANDRLGGNAMVPLSNGHVLALARDYDVAGATDAGTACEYAGNGAISGGPNETYCVMGTSAGSGPSWQVEGSRRGDPWFVLRPAERKLTIVGTTDRIFAGGFD